MRNRGEQLAVTPELPPGPSPSRAVPAATHTLRIPQVFHVGPMPNGRGSFIVMESLKLGGGCNMAELGRQLALMHLAEPAVSGADGIREGH